MSDYNQVGLINKYRVFRFRGTKTVYDGGNPYCQNKFEEEELEPLDRPCFVMIPHNKDGTPNEAAVAAIRAYASHPSCNQELRDDLFNWVGSPQEQFPYDPDYAVSPSETLAEWLNEREWTPELEQKLEALTGIPAAFWQRRQEMYYQRGKRNPEDGETKSLTEQVKTFPYTTGGFVEAVEVKPGWYVIAKEGSFRAVEFTKCKYGSGHACHVPDKWFYPEELLETGWTIHRILDRGQTEEMVKREVEKRLNGYVPPDTIAVIEEMTPEELANHFHRSLATIKDQRARIATLEAEPVKATRKPAPYDSFQCLSCGADIDSPFQMDDEYSDQCENVECPKCKGRHIARININDELATLDVEADFESYQTEIEELDEKETTYCTHVQQMDKEAESLKAENERLKKKVNQARWIIEPLLEAFLDEVHIPDRACSCHINPPCSDCVDYGGIRSTVEEAQAFLKDEIPVKTAETQPSGPENNQTPKTPYTGSCQATNVK